MPPPPDSCTALLTGPAFGPRLGSAPSSPPPASKESDRRLRRPAAGPPSWPQQAWTDSVDAFAGPLLVRFPPNARKGRSQPV